MADGGEPVRCRLFALSFTVLALAGCTNPDIPHVGHPYPTLSGRTESPAPLPPPSHKWRVSGLACPRLNRGAIQLGVSADATQTKGSGFDDIGRTVECQW